MSKTAKLPYANTLMNELYFRSDKFIIEFFNCIPLNYNNTAFLSYPPSLHQPFVRLLMMMSSYTALFPPMLFHPLIFIIGHGCRSFVVVVELLVADLFPSDLGGCFLNKAKDLLEFFRLRDFDLVERGPHLIQPRLRLDARPIQGS